MKIILSAFLFLFILALLACAPISHYEVVKVSDYGYIVNWKRNGVKIISVDTVKTVLGEEYIVKLK